jgi:hypothetical protein
MIWSQLQHQHKMAEAVSHSQAAVGALRMYQSRDGGATLWDAKKKILYKTCIYWPVRNT